METKNKELTMFIIGALMMCFFMVFMFWIGASCIEKKNHSDDIKVAGHHFDKMTKQAIANARKKGFKV